MLMLGIKSPKCAMYEMLRNRKAEYCQVNTALNGAVLVKIESNVIN